MSLPLSDKWSCSDSWAKIWARSQLFSPRKLNLFYSQQVIGNRLNVCSLSFVLINFFISILNADAMKLLFTLLSFLHIKFSFWSISLITIPPALAKGAYRNLRDQLCRPHDIPDQHPRMYNSILNIPPRQSSENSAELHVPATKPIFFDSPQNHYSYSFPFI